jgi:hypothetical protein
VSATRSGFSGAIRHRRLAGVLWLSLLASALVTWSPMKALFKSFDEGAFRDVLVKGWDGWAFLSFLAARRTDIAVAAAAVTGAFLVFALLQVFLTGGVLRVLIDGGPRPVFARVIAGSAGLFKANLWATLRFALTASIWMGLLVAAPVKLLGKLAKDAPPHTFLPDLAFWWALVAGAIVFLNVGLRYDLARIALARGDARNARGAYRVAKQRLAGRRASGIRIILFWLALGIVVQVVFTSAGLQINPRTDGAVGGLFLFRQVGFLLLAMVRVGFWAALLVWEERRRPAYSVIGSASGGTTWKSSEPMAPSAAASARPETGSSVTTNGSALLSS